MSPEELLRIPIQSQGRSPLLLIGGVMAAVFLGALLGALGRSLGVPEKVSYTFPLILGLGTAAFAVWYSVAPQGWIRIESDTLVVEPRMREARRWPVVRSEIVVRAWQLKSAAVKRTAGPLLELGGRGGAITIGANAPSLAEGLPVPEGVTLLVPPEYVVSRDDFVRLADALGVGSSLPPQP